MLLRKIVVVLLNFLGLGLAKKQEEKLDGNYDFVIIGGGTAGCVLASRLSEIQNWNILILEAGEDVSLLNQIPAMASSSILTEPTWNYNTEPSEESLNAFGNNQIIWRGGKSLGGSSTINFMMYSRGNPEDFENWANLVTPEWSYHNVLPYFLKSESSSLDFANKNYHNDNGLMNIAYSYYSDSAISFMKSLIELGFKTIDYNSNAQIGFSPIQGFLQNGARQSVNKAFIEPFRNRTNLKILTMSKVIKIIIDPASKKTKSVKFMQNGKRYRVLAKLEVVISAGVINTPHLLMLSGLGSKESLNQMEIPQIVNLPSIGRNLGDHLTYIGLNFLSNSTSTQFNVMADYLKELPLWYLTGRGTLTSLAGFENVAFLKSGKSPKNQTKPDFEILLSSILMNDLFRRIFNLKQEFYDQIYKPNENKIRWTIYPVLLHPKSRGHLELKSKNPNDSPRIYPNYLSNHEDIELMAEAIQFILDLTQTKEFRKMNLTLNPIKVPNCENFTSNDYWKCAIRSLSTSAHDQFGTCRMGVIDNPESVVDPHFNVLGIEGLRVVDASVIPTTISGHLEATVVMLAERAADFIKNDHLKT